MFPEPFLGFFLAQTFKSRGQKGALPLQRECRANLQERVWRPRPMKYHMQVLVLLMNSLVRIFFILFHLKLEKVFIKCGQYSWISSQMVVLPEIVWSIKHRLKNTEAVARRCSVKKVFLEISKETLAQTFSCKFCKIVKYNFSYKTPPVAPSGSSRC